VARRPSSASSPAASRPTRALQAGPAGTRLGYLEQGLSFAPGETVGRALGVDVDGLAAAEERLAALAARLATAGSERGQLEEA